MPLLARFEVSDWFMFPRPCRRQVCSWGSVGVLAGSVVSHGGPRVGMTGSDLNVAQWNSSIEHGGDIGVTQHVGVDAWQLDGSGRVDAFRRLAARRREC